MRPLFELLPPGRKLVTERDEWKARAERASEEAGRQRARADALLKGYVETQEYAASIKPRAPLWARVTALAWVFVVGVLVGGAAIPHTTDRPSLVTEPLVRTTPESPLSPPSVFHTPVGKPRRYAWNPLPHVDSYHWAFYRGNGIAFQGHTRTSEVTLALTPGRYQWVVWPVRKGVEDGKAIVNSIVNVR